MAMLRHLLQRSLPVLELQQLGSGARAFAAATKDYSLVLRQSEELASTTSVPPEHLNQVCYTYGVPDDVRQRKAHISCSSRTASQQGKGNSAENENAPNWKINFDLLPKWQNPLIGWTSSHDSLENVGRSSLLFYTKEEAVAFCVKSGWEYEVQEPPPNLGLRPKRYQSYGDNYSIKRGGVPKIATRWREMAKEGDMGVRRPQVSAAEATGASEKAKKAAEQPKEASPAKGAGKPAKAVA